MAKLLLFGPAREAAGLSHILLPGRNVGEIIAAAEDRFGEVFVRIMATSSVWLNGDAVEPDAPVHDGDEVAVIPPVSGG
jgi:molybdopterin converting factor small subunit